LKRWASILGLVGLALAVALVIHQGWTDVLSALEAGGIGLVWASLFHIVPMALNGRAWQALLGRHARPSVAGMTLIVWLREAVNGLLPVARIGGEVVSGRVLSQTGVRMASSVASIVVDMTVSMATQFVFTLVGLGLLALTSTDMVMVIRVGLGIAATVPVVIALLFVQKIGFFGLLSRLLHLLFGPKLAGWVGNPRQLDRSIHVLYRCRGRIWSCSLWQMAGWVAGSGEIWLMLYFLGHPVPVYAAIAIEALAQAISSAGFMVPGALGIQEGGFMLFGQAFGLSADTALALALARRVRDLVMFAPAVLLWQGLEGRKLMRGTESISQANSQ
jgi:putative membrane protein